MDNTLILALSIGGTFVLVGFIFLIAGIIINNNVKKIQTRCTEKTIGKVIDIVEWKSYTEDGISHSWFPVFEYIVGDRKLKRNSQYAGVSDKYKVGQEINIYYNPENPQDCYIEGEERKMMWIIIVGIITIGAGIFVGISIL